MVLCALRGEDYERIARCPQGMPPQNKPQSVSLYQAICIASIPLSSQKINKMNRILFYTAAVYLMISGLSSCSKDKEQGDDVPELVFVYQFDANQQRLDNLGRPSVIPSNHAAQSPVMNEMSAHYIEMAPSALSPLGSGEVVYRAAETTAGGSLAIDFDQAVKASNDQDFFRIPLKDVSPGEYEFLRVSLAYQNLGVQMYLDTVASTVGGPIAIRQSFPCTIAGFVGFNNYINDFRIGSQTLAVNGNRLQGFWGFESSGSIMGFPFSFVSSGQAPAGATTVVNPIQSSSPIPPGSCVVTAAFRDGKLKITGNETKDIRVVVSLSTNQSFEWTEVVNDGKWEPGKGEQIVDMGLRGMIPFVEN